LSRLSWKLSIDPKLAEGLAGVYRSYDVVGDIIIVKIPFDLEERRREIGRLLLERNPWARLVLRVAGKTNLDDRTRELERIAGGGPTLTKHREFGAVYVVDVAKVFFSPRLSYERWRVAQQVHHGERVANLFAGAGCFSIQIARQRAATVYSIDSNPDAIRCMRVALESNRLLGRVFPILGDSERVTSAMREIDRVILPLPAKADRFLGIASHMLGRRGIIHHYRECTGSRSECIPRSLRELEGRLSRVDEKGEFEVVGSRIVRSVGPRRWHIAHDILFRRDNMPTAIMRSKQI